MKNKVLLLACAVIVMMLCACQPLNVSSGESDVVTVAFRVAGEAVSAKAIAIGNPLSDSNVIFQYKAIPNFKADKIVGATGDTWTALPSDYNGSEFKMRFTKGQWTFNLRGIDKNDLTPLYKISIPLKVSLYSSSVQDIVFEMEEDTEGFTADGNSVGRVCLDVLAQSDSENGTLKVSYCTVTDDSYVTESIFNPIKIEDNKSYFKGTLNLASGNYIMYFTYHNPDEGEDTVMGPYDIKVISNKNTTVTGRIAHDSVFVVDFSAENNNRILDCSADFEVTAVPNGKVIVFSLSHDVEAKKPVLDAIAEKEKEIEKLDVELKDQKDEKIITELKEKIEVLNKKILVLDPEFFEKKAVAKKAETKQALVKQEEIIKIDPTYKDNTKKIGFFYHIFCDGILLTDQYAVNGKYSLDEKTLRDFLNKKDSNEFTITIKAVWTNNGEKLEAESEPITILFKPAEPVKIDKQPLELKAEEVKEAMKKAEAIKIVDAEKKMEEAPAYEKIYQAAK